VNPKPAFLWLGLPSGMHPPMDASFSKRIIHLFCPFMLKEVQKKSRKLRRV
jgi:hypothetical protein